MYIGWLPGFPISIFCAVLMVAEKVVDMMTHCIHFPKLHELDTVAEGFVALAQSEAFKKCVGAIDGCVCSGCHLQFLPLVTM